MIEISHLKKSYGTGESRFPVLHDLSLTVPTGEFLVILGASGSGKSTLLNIVSGLEDADGGSVIIDGQDLTSMNETARTAFRRETVAFIFQQYYLLPNLTVEKNVRLGADLVKNKDYVSALEEVGLYEKRHKFPNELSGGEQQRVSIARALAKRPRILFCDEPTGALDEETGRLVLDVLLKLREQNGMTMLMVTHNANIAETADRVIRLGSGRILSDEKNASKKSAFEIGW